MDEARARAIRRMKSVIKDLDFAIGCCESSAKVGDNKTIHVWAAAIEENVDELVSVCVMIEDED